MLLNLTIGQASDIIDSAEIIRKDQVIPGHFRPCPESPYPPGYDWLYRYEHTMAKFLESKLQSLPADLIGDKSLLNEALSNAFCHAHHQDRLKPITVSVLLGTKGFIIQVTDCGKGFNLQKAYKHYRKKRRYLTTVGNGIRRMAEAHQYGVFYNTKGTRVHLLYLFDSNLNELFADQVAVVPKSQAEAA
jgi:anti-sigma regulatory factor (Ser/Thr protein kinase)